ncbi:MAG TPA: riboflavin synthase [Terriglobales bacterium]|nr:riboflavin synthase [Terriglobales bacterium]
MFTGIVQALGTVATLKTQGAGARLEVRAAALAKRLKRGDSVAVNGCCLTVAARGASGFSADLTAETLDRTSLGSLTRGSRVNLEPSLRAGDPLGGHMLQGHVEATARLLGLTPVDAKSGWWLRVKVPDGLLRYIVPKGSLAVDGISLTVAEMSGSMVGFALIPYTYQHTHLRYLKLGTAMNIETDPIARHLERLLAARGAAPRLEMAELHRQGF